VTSQFDGDMVEACKVWGWNDKGDLKDDECDFTNDLDYNLKRAFDSPGIDTRKAGDKGPNRCYHLEHWFGPTVVKLPGGQLPKPIDQRYPGPDGVLRRVGNHASA
jgi:hypothetical protein